MEKPERKSWSQFDAGKKIAYTTAIIAFLLGWGLTIAGFIIGAGIISDSVLWVLGQSLVYAASVFGVGLYVGNEVRSMKRSIRSFMNAEDARLMGHNNDEELEEEDDEA